MSVVIVVALVVGVVVVLAGLVFRARPGEPPPEEQTDAEAGGPVPPVHPVEPIPGSATRREES